MELLLVRHALPVRVEGADGPADPVLAELGHEQARALAEWLAEEPLTAIYSSPLRRAVETAAPLAERHGIGPIVDEDLAEYDRHSPDYVPIEELKAEGDPRWFDMIAGEYSDAVGIDTAAWLRAAVAAVERVIVAHPGQTVAIVAHGGIVNGYLGHILGIAKPLWFEPSYTSISRVLASRDGHRQVRSVNETAHLRPLNSRD